jgi:hypothetical protein
VWRVCPPWRGRRPNRPGHRRARHAAAFRNRQTFDLAADGREKNTKGPAARLAAGQIGSFACLDYL